MRASFFLREPAFNCFSRAMASTMVGCALVVDELVAVVAGREAAGIEFCFVLPDAAGQVGRHAHVQRGAPLVGYDVYTSASFHRVPDVDGERHCEADASVQKKTT